MKQFLLISFFSAIIAVGCSNINADSIFQFRQNKQGVELLENNKPVLFYQRLPKSLDGRYVCANYIHPLYSLNGDTLTEEFPVDHTYHRGIFGAWHQMYVDGKSLGDGWIMENISQKVTDLQTMTSGNLAEMRINSVWQSELFENGKSFFAEETTITIHPKENNIRKIDFKISLRSLVAGVEIGGSDDEKGYGGFCARFKLPTDLKFVSENKPVAPKIVQVDAGRRMDFSASFNKKGETSGVAILCHPDTPNYPAP